LSIDLARHRPRILRTTGMTLFLLVVLSAHGRGGSNVYGLILDYVSFLFVLLCAFGRLWAGVYISGYKTAQVITDGPYAMVRNPLYLFSLFGFVGLGLATKSLVIVTIILVVYLGIYPVVIRAEERKLLSMHGDAYKAYLESTPRFLPDFSRLREAGQYTVNVTVFRTHLLESAGFLLLYMLVQLIHDLHRTGVLPVLFTLP